MTSDNIELTNGLTPEGIRREKHPMWYPPKLTENINKDSPDVLKVLNSLTETLEVFAPRNGRLVKWYTCGPTVYDMSHMGHARAYLTFDILRRIMEDYFSYSVQYEMNITDIDDKIIKKARVNKLLADFHEELNYSLESLNTAVAESIVLAETGLMKKRDSLLQPLPEGSNSRLRNEREEKLKELDLKIEQLSETKEKIEKRKGDFEALFVEASGVLGELLDMKKGGTVTDQSIFEQHARKYEALFFEDMRRLGIRDADMITRVTEYVPEVVEFVKKIMDNNFAYIGKSSIFFDTQAFIAAGHSYPKLKPTSDNAVEETTEAEMAEGEGVLSTALSGEKKHPNDFALWKFSKPGEPRWDSPWGPGRPGWHIECSVMANDILGEDLDIHAGGWDLKFPHHDNECAQSEAFSCKHQWVNYFFHCGHLHIKGLKMSKSLKNFITIKEALDDLGVTARQMRLLFLSNDWNRPMNFSDQSIGAAREQERVLRAFFGSVHALLREDMLAVSQHMTEADRVLYDKWVSTESAVHQAFCDNFNTPVAMQSLMSLVAATNQYLCGKERVLPSIVKKIARYITKILNILGVNQNPTEIGFDDAESTSDGAQGSVEILNAAVGFRDEVRAATLAKKETKDILQICDDYRDEKLARLGVRLEDRPNGEPTLWKLENPDILVKEIQERRAATKAENIKKMQNQLTTKQKEYSKYVKFELDPAQFYRVGEDAEKYSAFDDEGIPTATAAGESLTEKQQQKLKREVQKYAKQRADVMKKEEESGHYSKLKGDIDRLEKELLGK